MMTKKLGGVAFAKPLREHAPYSYVPKDGTRNVIGKQEKKKIFIKISSFRDEDDLVSREDLARNSLIFKQEIPGKKPIGFYPIILLWFKFTGR
jgi:hypothetical protein